MQITNIISQLPRSGTQDSPHTLGQITHIIVHHDAVIRDVAYDSVARYRAQSNGHIGRGEDGIQYHYKIDNVGEVFQCRNITDTLWHCANYPINRASIGICLDGDFTRQAPTQEQYNALKELLDWLCTEHPEFPADQNDVFGHTEVSLTGTACPGSINGYVQAYRSGKSAVPKVAFNDGTMGGTEPIPQVVPAPVPTPAELYRVFNGLGVQIGAYAILENAKSKLDTVQSGIIKNSAGTVVFEKKEIPKSDVPPFKGDDPAPTVPQPPVVIPPPVVEPAPEPTPDPIPEPKPPVKPNWFKIISDFIKSLFDAFKRP